MELGRDGAAQQGQGTQCCSETRQALSLQMCPVRALLQASHNQSSHRTWGSALVGSRLPSSLCSPQEEPEGSCAAPRALTPRAGSPNHAAASEQIPSPHHQIFLLLAQGPDPHDSGVPPLWCTTLMAAPAHRPALQRVGKLRQGYRCQRGCLCQLKK